MVVKYDLTPSDQWTYSIWDDGRLLARSLTPYASLRDAKRAAKDTLAIYRAKSK